MNKQRLIDANRLIEALQRNFGWTGGADMLKQLIDNAPAIEARERWISVEDRLPEESGHYCVMIKDATRSTELYYSNSDKTWFDNDEEYAVTHWMPLPEPPKED